MSVEESLIRASDVRVEEVTITNIENGTTVDLSNFMVELNLFEDIFAPCMSGTIVIVDSMNLITDLPIIGTELITIKVRTPTLEDHPSNIIEKTFQLYSIENRALNDDRGQIYSLCFISREGYLDRVSTISKTFRGSTDEIVAKIYTDYLNIERRADVPGKKTSLKILDTPHFSKVTYVSNNWTPFKNFNFISKRVKGNTLMGADYVFFESNKSFYFSSIEALIASSFNEGIFEEYVYELVENTIPRRKAGECSGNVFPPAMTRIETITMPKTLDLLDGLDSGYFSNSIYGYNLITKEFSVRTYDINGEFDKFVKTDANMPVPSGVLKNPFANTAIVSYNSQLHNDYGLTNETYGERSVFRRSYLNSFNQYKFEITIPGRTDIEVGKLINILYPAGKVKVDGEIGLDNIFDSYLSGPYLISAIHHKIGIERHVMVLEVIKNGLGKSLG